MASHWNPAQYDKFASERSLPFLALVSLIRDVAFERAIDLGYGTGFRTRWPMPRATSRIVATRRFRSTESVVRITFRPSMRASIRTSVALTCIACIACSQPSRSTSDEANAGIDALNARLVQAYREHDPQAYAATFTDTAVFEWPAFTTVRGRAGLAAMARENWSALRDMDLRLIVSARRMAPGHATEFGAFQQSWRDSSGARQAEFGRYVAVLVRQEDDSWRMDRFFGFSDSTRSTPTRP